MTLAEIIRPVRCKYATFIDEDIDKDNDDDDEYLVAPGRDDATPRGCENTVQLINSSDLHDHITAMSVAGGFAHTALCTHRKHVDCLTCHGCCCC